MNVKISEITQSCKSNGSETACSDEINRNDVHLIQVSFQECGGKGVCSIMDKYQQRSPSFLNGHCSFIAICLVNWKATSDTETDTETLIYR